MKRVLVVLIVIAALGAGGFWVWSSGWLNSVNYDNYDFNALIEGDQYNGNIADHVKGNPEAPVLIFEYADYQCPGCGTTNPRLNKLLEEYGDQLGIVYRNYLLSYHQNGTAAASAAEAAGLQGYWKEYADHLFANQTEWEYAGPKDRTDIFKNYFTTVSNGEGDLDRFEADMGSSVVSKKIRFDMAIGKRVEVSATPALFINGEQIDFSKAGTEELFLTLMREKIDAALAAKGLKKGVEVQTSTETE